MQLNDPESIFFNNINITIEGYCTCDLYFPTTKQTNFQKNKAHYVQIFYLTCKYGLYQLFISEENNICDLERVVGFEEPEIILENKLSENYTNILYHYYTLNKNTTKNKRILAFLCPTDESIATYIYDFKDFLILIDESNYTDIRIFYKKHPSMREVNDEDFYDYVINLDFNVAPAGSLDEKLNNFKKNNIFNSTTTTSSDGGPYIDIR